VNSSDTASTGADNGVNLTINAPLVITATPNPDTVCYGSNAVIKGIGGDPGRYQWFKLPNETIEASKKDTLIVPVTQNETYRLWGRIGPDYGCSDSTTVKIVVQQKPVVSVTDTAKTCIGLGAVLKATGGTKYLWGNGSTKDSLVVFPTKDTMVVVSITKGYCTIKDTGYVKVFRKIAVLVNSPTICEGATATLTASGAFTYSWSTNQTGPSITVAPITNTTYTVKGTNGSCTAQATATVTVDPKPDVKVETPKPVCEGESVTLTATGAVTYQWVAAVPDPTLATITVKTPISRWYKVYGFSDKKCRDSATVFVTIDQRPNVEVNSPTICLGGTAILKALGAAHYEWQTKETTDSIYVSPTKNTIYSVIGFSENRSCTDTAYGYVTVGKPVKVDISGDLDIFSCETTVLSATPTDGTYEWSVIGASDGKIDCETCPSTGVTPPRTMAYVVTYRSPIGCIGKDTALVEVTEINSYFLATALTPNGDGVNDVVQVHGRGIDHITFMIFDRIGEKVFETHEIEKGWDGTYLGLPMNSNVFVYRLEIYFCNGDVKKESGNITILK
jgi:gliding motility-associated-like protein